MPASLVADWEGADCELGMYDAGIDPRLRAVDWCAVEVVARGKAVDQVAVQSGRKRRLRPSDRQVGGDAVSLRDVQELLCLGFDRNQDSGQCRAQSFVSDGENEVLHERVNARAAHDAAGVEGLVGRCDGSKRDQDHQVNRDQVNVIGVVVRLRLVAWRGNSDAWNSYQLLRYSSLSRVRTTVSRTTITRQPWRLPPARREPGVIEHPVDDLIGDRIRPMPPGTARAAHDIGEFHDHIIAESTYPPLAWQVSAAGTAAPSRLLGALSARPRCVRHGGDNGGPDCQVHDDKPGDGRGGRRGGQRQRQRCGQRD